MILINRIFALVIVSLNLTASASVSVKEVVLTDDTIIESKYISAINFDENFDAVNSIELYDEILIDSSEIKSIILRRSNNSSGFNTKIQNSTRATHNGNGSGG